MPDLFICSGIPDIMDNKVIEITLDRLNRDQGSITQRLGGIDRELVGIGKDIVEIKATIKPKDLHWAVRFLVLPLAVASIIAAAGALIHLEIAIAGIGKDISSISKSVARIQRFQAASEIDSAGQEAKAGQTQDANMHLREAAELLEEVASAHVPAPPSFFEQSVRKLDQLSSAGLNEADVHRTLVKLAEYRSALQQSPNFPPSNWRVVSLPMTISEIEQQFIKQGGMTVLHAANPDVQFLAPPTNENAVTVKNIVFVGGKQKLDGFTWAGVTFVGTAISFDGTHPTVLDRTSFVNCRFNVPNQPHATPLLEYAALADAGQLQLKP